MKDIIMGTIYKLEGAMESLCGNPHFQRKLNEQEEGQEEEEYEYAGAR